MVEHCLAEAKIRIQIPTPAPNFGVMEVDMEKQHTMYLLSADLKEVNARLSRKFQASLAQQEERRIRTPQNGVQGVSEAPDGPEAA